MNENFKFIPARIIKKDDLSLELINKPVRIKKDFEIMEDKPRDILIKGHLGPKCYVSTCYFTPKQVPVSYSETMIWKIGSNKKKFFESIYYKNILSPNYWSETMMANLNYDGCKTEISIPCEEEFHYISLTPNPEIEMKEI